MNNKQKEVEKQLLEDEKQILEQLKENYSRALVDVKERIKNLTLSEMTQSKIYQKQYQQNLEKQLQSIVDLLSADNVQNINDYLIKTYQDGFIGTLYNMQSEGVPFIMQINQETVLKSISRKTEDFQLSKTLYQNADELKKTLKSEITRGISQGYSYNEISKKITLNSEADLKKSYRIARTEGGRVQTEAKFECMKRAKANGADVVKEWDSTMDHKTRESHVMLDGQIKELDEPFEVNGYTAMYPHNFGIASEDINCRCILLERARWAVEDDNSFTKNVDGDIVEFQNVKDYQDYKEKYFNFYQKDDKMLSLNECQELIEKQGITFWKNDLARIDKRLLSDNTKRLNELIEKYPQMKDYIKSKNVKFNALSLKSDELAHVSTDLDIKNIEISLSKKAYANYQNLIKLEENELLNRHCMDRLDQYKSTYTITHEFGHLIESVFIDEYNKQHLAEFINMKSKALNAKSISQSKKIIEKWETKIADEIAQDIYDIAMEHNPDIKIVESLSNYGQENSFEFFAECFANLECGKSNDLGKALEEYLKKRGL